MRSSFSSVDASAWKSRPASSSPAGSSAKSAPGHELRRVDVGHPRQPGRADQRKPEWPVASSPSSVPLGLAPWTRSVRSRSCAGSSSRRRISSAISWASCVASRRSSPCSIRKSCRSCRRRSAACPCWCRWTTARSAASRAACASGPVPSIASPSTRPRPRTRSSATRKSSTSTCRAACSAACARKPARRKPSS